MYKIKFNLEILSLCFLLITSNTFAESKTALESCLALNREQIAPPHVDISSIQATGRAITQKLLIKGSFEGVCLKEAGLYQDGKILRRFKKTTEPKFKRYDFLTKADMADSLEVRVYTVHGDRVTAQLNSNNKEANKNQYDVKIIISQPDIYLQDTPRIPYVIPAESSPIIVNK